MGGILPDMRRDDTDGKAPSALVVVDMINRTTSQTGTVARPSARSGGEHRPADGARPRPTLSPVIYVNDNYDDFAASRKDLIERADGRHPELVEPVLPAQDGAFLRQGAPQRLLRDPAGLPARRAEIGKLILTGQVTEQCILYSALDAYVRHYESASRAMRSRHRPGARRGRAADDGAQHARRPRDGGGGRSALGGLGLAQLRAGADDERLRRGDGRPELVGERGVGRAAQLALHEREPLALGQGGEVGDDAVELLALQRRLRPGRTGTRASRLERQEGRRARRPSSARLRVIM